VLVVSKSRRVILGPPNQWSKAEICYNKTRPMYVPIMGLSSFQRCIDRAIDGDLIGADINVSVFSKSVPLCHK
jgi:hypothetical protein